MSKSEKNCFIFITSLYENIYYYKASITYIPFYLSHILLAKLHIVIRLAYTCCQPLISLCQAEEFSSSPSFCFVIKPHFNQSSLGLLSNQGTNKFMGSPPNPNTSSKKPHNIFSNALRSFYGSNELLLRPSPPVLRGEMAEENVFGQQ